MEREAFLKRVSTALGRTDTSAPNDGNGVSGVPDFYRSASIGGDRIDRFVTELDAVGGRVVRASTVAEASALLRGLVPETASVLTWDRSEFEGWGVDWLWDDAAAKAGVVDLSAEIGVTTVDYAVANTGTIVLTTSASRARSASLVVSTHIALVKAEQIVDRLGEAFAGVSGRGPMPSGMYCITGPSRSADIENDLTIGVHGPAALVVVLLTPQTGVR